MDVDPTGDHQETEPGEEIAGEKVEEDEEEMVCWFAFRHCTPLDKPCTLIQGLMLPT